MPHKRLFCLFLLSGAFALSSAFAVSVSDTKQRQQAMAASLFVLGHLLPEEELERIAQESASYEAAKKAVRSRKLSNAQRADVYAYAYRDVFGVAPAKSGVKGEKTYIEHARDHLRALQSDVKTYESVIERAYQFVIQRAPYEEEVAYWKERGTFPYVLLVGGIEDWARRNQPGLMVTAGQATINVNCPFLTTARLDPGLAAGIRKAEALSGDLEAGETIVYPGSAGFQSMGKVPFALCGSLSRES